MKRILVIGATGRQGRGVISDLEQRGHDIVGFVRSRDDAAQALERRGVELAVGSLDDPASITAAAKGTDAVFAMTTPFAGLDTEVGIVELLPQTVGVCVHRPNISVGVLDFA